MTHCLVQKKNGETVKQVLYGLVDNRTKQILNLSASHKYPKNEETPKEDTSPPSFGNMSISSEVSHLFFQLSGNCET